MLTDQICIFCSNQDQDQTVHKYFLDANDIKLFISFFKYGRGYPVKQCCGSKYIEFGSGS